MNVLLAHGGRLLSAFLVVLFALQAHAADTAAPMNVDTLMAATARVELVDGAEAPSSVKLDRQWQGNVCTATLSNTGSDAVQLQRVVLFRLAHDLPAETELYGEGFTMLSQTGGTLGAPQDIGGLTDASHYKIPQPADATTVYNVLHLSPPRQAQVLLGFTSSERFVGKFHLWPGAIEVVLDLEGLELPAGAAWNLEEFIVTSGTDRSALFAELAARIHAHHPRLSFDPVPTGWCSWYCFGPMVTRGQVEANLAAVKEKALPLRYIQIDDGYQAAMGDWLETGPAFQGGIREVLQSIHDGGCEPAIWVAPFVAEENSKLFKEHPDWFIKDDEGKPLRSDRVTFGGWRLGPWYAIDGTHPGAQQHLESVFRTMREEWGCTYFKLDANFWGAMHGGHFHDPKATRVEAYRRGMEAVLRGAGDSFILGCNHPLWPSLGLVHGSRSSGDVSRSWDNFKHLARENFSRNWQNGSLWWNDPDCVLLTGKLSDDEFQFHASTVYAAGGMTLSGDNLKVLRGERLAMLRKLLPPTGVAAQFKDSTFQIGTIPMGNATHICVFNWGDEPQTIEVPLEGDVQLTDFWNGANLGQHKGTFTLADMPPHSARILVSSPAGTAAAP